MAFGTKKTKVANTYIVASKAADRETFAKWVKARIADRVGTDLNVVYHGMMKLTVPDPNAPNVYFVRERDFISRIVQYPGGSP